MHNLNYIHYFATDKAWFWHFTYIIDVKGHNTVLEWTDDLIYFRIIITDMYIWSFVISNFEPFSDFSDE